MKSLKILAAPLALAAGLAVALPAQAAPYQRHDSWHPKPAGNTQIRRDINSLGNAIDRAAARRVISQREANGLRKDARGIQRLYVSYARGGLNRNEVRNLQSRVNNIRVALRMERRDWDGRRG